MTHRFTYSARSWNCVCWPRDIKMTNTSHYDDKNEIIDPSILLSVGRLISTSCLIIQMCQFE